MIKNIVVTFILAASLASSIEASVTFEPCEPISSLKPDPKNCSRFYECTEAGWEGNECSIGLEFNPATKLCDYPKNVVCPGDISIEAVTFEPCEPISSLKPDPKNCSRFYECTEAGWEGNECSIGLEFNPATKLCDYPKNVVCPSDISIEAVMYEPCQNIDELKPDPKNCSRFYECTRGGWVGLACKSGLVFNPDMLYCDYPWNVVCPSNIPIRAVTFEPCEPISSLKPDPKNCSRFYECTEAGWEGNECSIGLEFNPATHLCDYPKNVVCPGDISIEAVTFEPCEPISSLKPDPKNCSRFYECTEAGWEGNECSIGLEFNPATKLCDYPKNVVCPSDISIEAVTFEPCEPISSLKPDPKNCSRFYECTEAGWEGNECSIGLEFNPATHLCDYPKNVVCPSGISVRANVIPEPCDAYQYYPDPENCSWFYFCPGDQVLDHEYCGEGALFDPVLLHCNAREKVKCSVCYG